MMYNFRNPSTSSRVIGNNINKLGNGPSQLLVLPPLLPKALPALLDWVDLPSLADGVTGIEGGIGLLLLGGGGNGGPFLIWDMYTEYAPVSDSTIISILVPCLIR